MKAFVVLAGAAIAATSRSRDFAWTLGRYRGPAGEHGGFVRAWQAEDGRCKIVADVLAPLEAPT